MISWVLHAAGFRPDFLIGGVAENFDSTYGLEGGRNFVIEGDEYDSAFFDKGPKFLHYQPFYAVIGNLEYDHADIYPDLEAIKRIIEESGHSRLPVCGASLDEIMGILYARDMLKYVGLPAEQFNIRSAMRQPLYVPETKPLGDLLSDFRQQKVHIAIVLDEYGGTAGLVTIEDVLEELVGEISDEHEPAEPAMFKRIGEQAFEADARIPIEELNRLLGLNLPEEAGFETLGGFVSTTVGRIPETGAAFEFAGARYTVLDAAPQKVKRIQIDLAQQPAVVPPQA
jgi:CBS domain containing-hemolysin-like protein